MRASRRAAILGLLVGFAVPERAFAFGQDAWTAQQAPIQAPPSAPAEDKDRVRITTGPEVELAGVIRFRDGIMSAAAAIIRQDENTVSLRVDSREVTVLRPKRRAVGVISDADAATLQVTSESGQTVTVPRGAIERYEVGGRGSRFRNAAIGLVVGTVAGCLLGIATADECSGADLVCVYAGAASSVYSAGLGAGIGAGIGALMPRPTRWKTLPLDQLPN